MAGLQEMENAGFQPGDQRGISAEGYYQPKQLPEGVGFMEKEDKGDPFFGVIADHVENLRANIGVADIVLILYICRLSNML
jgi:hypothetical protein